MNYGLTIGIIYISPLHSPSSKSCRNPPTCPESRAYELASALDLVARRSCPAQLLLVRAHFVALTPSPSPTGWEREAARRPFWSAEA